MEGFPLVIMLLFWLKVLHFLRLVTGGAKQKKPENCQRHCRKAHAGDVPTTERGVIVAVDEYLVKHIRVGKRKAEESPSRPPVYGAIMTGLHTVVYISKRQARTPGINGAARGPADDGLTATHGVARSRPQSRTGGAMPS